MCGACSSGYPVIGDVPWLFPDPRQALVEYLNECQRRGMRCVRVVHGKGHGSPNRQPVLKAKVQRWLAQSAEVIAFAQASGPQGGAGALIVLRAG